MWGICGAALVLAGACVALTLNARRNQRKIPGVYLADGGVACIVIGRNMEVEKNYLIENRKFRVSAAKVGQGFRLDGTYWSPGPTVYRWHVAYRFSPSRSRSGDWDLVGYGPTALDFLSGVEGWVRQVQRAVSLGRTLCDPLTRSVPYLYRTDDPNVTEYFRLQYDTRNPNEAFEKARLLLERHPDDPHFRALYLSAAAHNNDTSEVTHRWEEWKPLVENPDDPCLAYANRQTQRWIRSRRLTAAGRNAYDLLRGILVSETELPPWPRLLSMALDCERYAPDWLPGVDAMSHFRLTGATDLARVLHIMALLRMFEGKRRESLTFLAAIYHLGQLMSETDNLVEMMVGIICRTIALNGLKLYALNCCESESDLKELWEVLERFEKREGAVAASRTRSVEMSFGEYLPQHSAIVEPRMQDRTIIQTEFELLRMATAARYRLVTQGDFPKTNEEFAPLLPQGPPKDPFGDGPLRFRRTTDSLVCHSIGPEEEDRRAAKSTRRSSTTARREISIRVPRQREYPFPRDGVRAMRVEDLMRQFPNGLPIDPWGNRMETTITTTGDILVYSGGPSRRAFREPLGDTSHALTLQYDPTNGLFSQGAMFIRIPRR
jgi:hypothetical protein